MRKFIADEFFIKQRCYLTYIIKKFESK